MVWPWIRGLPSSLSIVLKGVCHHAQHQFYFSRSFLLQSFVIYLLWVNLKYCIFTSKQFIDYFRFLCLNSAVPLFFLLLVVVGQLSLVHYTDEPHCQPTAYVFYCICLSEYPRMLIFLFFLPNSYSCIQTFYQLSLVIILLCVSSLLHKRLDRVTSGSHLLFLQKNIKC